MTDAHYHRNGYETYFALNDREFRFMGIHPWEVDSETASHRNDLTLSNGFALPNGVGVGEIGMDRLKTKTISNAQRIAFESQLAIAAEHHRPVVLHGAKCWGEVVKACKKFMGTVPAFLFHGFSRSTGLIPEIISLNGFISIGPAILNDHAVNYLQMAKSLPINCLLVETDLDISMGTVPSHFDLINKILNKLAEIRNCDFKDLETAIDGNAAKFLETLA